MRFYTQSHKHFCGIDLHARSMYLCILDTVGEALLHRNMKATPQAFLSALGAAIALTLLKETKPENNRECEDAANEGSLPERYCLSTGGGPHKCQVASALGE